MKSDQYYYNTDEYREKLQEVEERKAEILAERELEATQKAKEVKTEKIRLKKIFNKERVGEQNVYAVNALIDRAAFLRVELEHIETTLRKEGVLDFFTQGLQTMWREHPLSKVHVQYVKNYKDIITKLEAYGKQDDYDKKSDNPLFGLIQHGSDIRKKYQK